MNELDKKPFIIPVFLPNFGCPHHCVFCNQTAITGVRHKCPSPETLRALIQGFLRHKGRHRKTVQIAFYGGNFLGLKTQTIELLLTEGGMFVKNGRVNSLRFSTRPDTITEKSLDILKKYPVSTIELGVQSMDDRVLLRSKRGHTSSDTEIAVHRLKKKGFSVGLQIMVGLPGDDETTSLATAQTVAALRPDFVRIYPTLVLKNSILAQWYEHGKYRPLALDESVTRVKKLYLLFRENKIPVIRMGLQISDDLQAESEIVAGPYHPAFGHLVHSEIFLDRAISAIASKKDDLDTARIHVHPRSVSKLRGIRNGNIDLLTRRFQIRSLKIVEDPSLDINSVSVAPR